MKIVLNAPRYVRSFLRHTIKQRPLFIIKVDEQWRFAVLYQGEYIVIGQPLRTRQLARTEAVKRYGIKAKAISGSYLKGEAA